MKQFVLNSIITCMILCLVIGCGKKEPQKPAQDSVQEEAKSDTQIPEREKPAEKPSLPEETETADKEKEREPEGSSGNSPEQSEAQKLYDSVIKLKEEEEYQKAFLTATDLMSRLPKTVQAQNVIPVYHSLKKLLMAKRSCDEHYELLRDATEIRDRYAAEKFFLENSEVGAVYLSGKLKKADGKEFDKVLDILTKMKEVTGLETMISLLLGRSRQNKEDKLIVSILAFRKDLQTGSLKKVLQHRKSPLKDLQALISRTGNAAVIPLLGNAYGTLGKKENQQINNRIQAAGKLTGINLYRECAVIRGIIEGAFDSGLRGYLGQIKEKEKLKQALADITGLARHIAKEAEKAGATELADALKKTVLFFMVYPEGLVLHCPLDGSGESSAGPDGKTHGASPAEDRLGQSGKALAFNGSNSVVNLGNPDILQITGDCTLSFWVYPQNIAAARQNPVDKAYGGEFGITFEPNGSISYFHGEGKGRTDPYASWSWGSVLKNKQWLHICIVRDVSQKAVNCFVNGKLQKITQPAWKNPSKSREPLTLGTGYAGGFRGCIDEMMIFKTALTPDQVKSIYSIQSSK